MKCIKKSDEVRRVENEKAFNLVKQGWAFCPKSEYKKAPKKKTEVVESEQVAEKPKVKKQKRMGMSKEERVAKALAERNVSK